MKFTIKQSDFIESLKTVSRAVSGMNTLPVLGNILIKAEGKKVSFTTTNLELSIINYIEADVKNEGAITVPAKILTSYISLLGKDDDIDISAQDGVSLEIKSKKTKTKIKGIPAEDFPEIKTVESGVKLQLKTGIFRDSVNKVAFCAQENSSRPVLSGVFIKTDKNKMFMVATDSYRLSEKILKLDKEVENTNCIIPVKAILEADRLASQGKTIDVIIGENQIMFSNGNTKLTSRLIDGQFPDYQQIIPKTQTTTLEINREEFELAVRRVSIFSKENNQHMKLQVQSDGVFEVMTDTTEIGEGKSIINTKIEGKSNQIALNSDYVLDILGALSNQGKIKLELDSIITPAVIKLAKEDEFVHLVMPLKL